MAVQILHNQTEMDVPYQGMTLGELAGRFQADFKGKIALAEVDDRLKELHEVVEENSRIKWLDTTTADGYRVLQRGLSFVMVRSIYEVMSQKDEYDYEVDINFSLNHGFYCEIKQIGKEHHDLLPVTRDFLDKVSEKMKEYIKAEVPINKSTVKTKQAIELFKKQNMPSKEALMQYRRASETNVYELDGIYDYYYGYMVPNTSYLSNFELHLYEEGFVLQFQAKANPEQVAPFYPDKKLYQTLKTTSDWGKLIQVENTAELNKMIQNGRMQDLILVTEALMEKTISEIGTQIAANIDKKKFVFIAGPSSSGKTTFAHRLSIQLLANGIRAKIISVDDYFVDREKTPRDEEGNYDFESIHAIDIEDFNKDMSNLLAGKKVHLPRFDFITGRRQYAEAPTELLENEILIVEGIHCLNDELSYSLPKENKYKVYISALTQLNLDGHNRIPTTDGRCIRRMVRDFQYRGVTAEKTILMWNSVRRGEEKYIFPYQESADFMFNSAHIYELSILKQYADPLLFNIPESSPAYNEARRLLKFLDYFLGYGSENVPSNSILREFIGGSTFRD